MHSAPDALFAPVVDSPILIVEDNAVNRLFLEKTLRAQGFTRLLSVDTAEEALSRLEDFQPEMVILDILLPGMDGFRCCEEIRRRAHWRDLPILIETTITEPALRARAFEKGATDFVSKPVYPDELCARVRVHLENRRSLKALRLYKNRIETELESARQLQQSILPDARDIKEIGERCHLDVASCFSPSSEIGGDFWGIKSLFSNLSALWLVDFSGHGVAAALNAFRLQAYLQEHSTLAARPGDYLSHLNNKLLHLLLRGQFATMFYGIADTLGNRLFYACACAPHPVILRRDTGEATLLDGSGAPLGVGMQLYPTQIVPFAPGDTLLLYSDVLTETPDAQGKYIAERDIMRLLEAHAGATSAEIRDALLAHFAQHAANALRYDLTLVVCTRAIS